MFSYESANGSKHLSVLINKKYIYTLKLTILTHRAVTINDKKELFC